MKNQHAWHPTKFVRLNGRYRASRDPKQVAPGSRLITDRLAAAYEEALRRHARGALLDLGCGQVPLFDVYRSLVSDVVCVDWAARGEVSHLDHTVDLNQSIPLPDARFDTVLATDVFEHIAHPTQLFAEVSRMLRDDGTLIAGVPFLYWIHEEPHDYYRYTEFALRLLCEENGLTVLSVDPYGGGLDVALDTIAKTLSYGRLGASFLGRWLVPAVVLIGQACVDSRLGRRVSHATARSLPLGYCLIATKDRAPA